MKQIVHTLGIICLVLVVTALKPAAQGISINAEMVKDWNDLKATTKAGIIKEMDDSFDYGTAILKELTDQTMLQAAAMPPGFMGPSSKARIFTFLIGHTWDIYGQMAVYLRLNGVVPPASVRP